MKRRGASRSSAPGRDRIHKVLAGRGVGSLRQVEAWIAAGRITVNGKLAQPGQPVGERDDIRLDGRRLRLRGVTRVEHRGLVYHRPAREEIRGTSAGEGRSSLERLPKAAGRRWIPVSPLAANDAGLELFVTDGALAAALTRRGHVLPSEYSLRLRGDFDDSRIEALMSGIAGTELEGSLTAILPAGGEGTNRWVNVSCTGLRPRDLKGHFERNGFEPNRVMRTRLGPIAMDRGLARGRSRLMTDEELSALWEFASSQPAPVAESAGSRKSSR
ncbi:MAG: S4 domain-containing protein [Steroidobacteraceae bacterium]